MKRNRIIALNPATAIVRAVLIGTVGGAGLCALLLFLAAAILQASGNLPQDLLQPLTLLICGVSCFFGGFLCGKISRKRGLLFGAGCGLLLFLLCLIGGGVNAHEVATVSAMTRLAVMVLAGALGGVLSMRNRQNIR